MTPAKIELRSLIDIKLKEREDLLQQESALFAEVWSAYNSEFKAAILSGGLEDAHRIWCLACEPVLWKT